MAGIINLLWSKVSVLSAAPPRLASYDIAASTAPGTNFKSKTTHLAPPREELQERHCPWPIKIGKSAFSHAERVMTLKVTEAIPDPVTDYLIFQALNKSLAPNKVTLIRHSAKGNLVLLMPPNISAP